MRLIGRGGSSSSQEAVDPKQRQHCEAASRAHRERRMARRSQSQTGGTPELIDRLLAQAVQQRASDVHFEPADDCMRVRFRIDGRLYDTEILPASQSAGIVSRLKVMASLLTYRIDIPQEGGLRAEEKIEALNGADVRVATFPTIRGERAVVRLFYAEPEVICLDELGLSVDAVARVRTAAERPDGLILVTGPAGSGKTTTLYAVVRHILQTDSARSVITLEDPVEQRIAGATQIQIAPHGQLNYARAMRSLLRQDPQVLLVGEIRDAETAGIVIEAALTGHLVMSTMHSGDPAETIVRLLEMGLPAYQIVSTVTLVCSQRLIRTLCPQCRRATGTESSPYEPVGCERCHQSGHLGRTACAQVVALDDELRAQILAVPDTQTLRAAITQHASSLFEDGMRWVKQGRASIHELRRVIGGPPGRS